MKKRYTIESHFDMGYQDCRYDLIDTVDGEVIGEYRVFAEAVAERTRLNKGEG